MFKSLRLWLLVSLIVICFEFVLILFLFAVINSLNNEISTLRSNNTQNTVATTNIPTPTANPIQIIPSSKPNITLKEGCEPLPHVRIFPFAANTGSLSAVTDVKNALPQGYPGMRYFYIQNATIGTEIESFYLDYGCNGNISDFDYLNISGEFYYKEMTIGFMQGFWGKGGICMIPIDLTFLGKSVTICAESTDVAGENIYYGFLIGSSSDNNITKLNYELAIYFQGYYSNTQIQELLDNITAIK